MEITYCQICHSMIGPRESASVRTADGNVVCTKCAHSKPATGPNRIARKTTGSFRRQSGALATQAPAQAPTPPPGPAVDAGSMKFYFCETCGKRVTDLDIQKGAGRDKKLKGVYCQNCAVGVTTMVDMPIVGDAPSAPRPPAHARKNTDSERAQEVRSAAKPFPLGMIALSGSGILVLAVVGFFIAGRGNGRHTAAVPTPPIQTPHAPTLPVSPHTIETPTPEQKTNPTDVTVVKSPVAPDKEEEKTQAAPELLSVSVLPPATEKPPETKIANAPDPAPVAPAKTAAPVPPTPATVAPSNGDAELVSKVVRLLGQHRTADAAGLVRDNKEAADASKQELIAALNAVQKEEKEFQDQLSGQAGKAVKLQTAKETVEGKLIAVDYPVMRIEKSISINGESIGSTVVSLNAYDLNDASRQSLYHPGDADGAAWAGRALAAMGFLRMAEADSAMAHLNEHALKEALAAELKRQKIVDTEARAEATWTAITARAKETPTQSRAKQLIVDLAAFEKNFGSTEFASSPGVSTPLAEMKERMERMATGLDPRVISLFKGRVVSYDAPSAVMTLSYDFSTKDQTEDFIGSIWAPPGDATGLTWTKGKLKTFCKTTFDCLLQMPQFTSNTVNIQIEYQDAHGSWGNAAVFCGFYGVKSDSKSPKIHIEWNNKACAVFADRGVLKTTPSTFGANKQGKLEFACQDKAVSVKLNGATIIEHTLAKPNDHAGFWIGGGWDCGLTMTHLQVSGRLDPVWLANALKAAK